MKVNVLFIVATIILCVATLILNATYPAKEIGFAPVSSEVNLDVVTPILTPTAPTIKKFANPSGSLAGPYNPVINGLAQTYFSVLIEDLNGNQELPTTSSLILNNPSSSGAAQNVIAGYYAPLSSPNREMNRPAQTCVVRTCAQAVTEPQGIICDLGRESLQEILLCDTPLLQTDPPGEWRFAIIVADSIGLASTLAISGDLTGLYPETMMYNSLKAAHFGTVDSAGIQTPESFIWNGLSSTQTNQVSTPVTITNIGNVPINSMTITGTDLIGVTTGSTLSKTAFRISVSNTEQCSSASGIQLSALAQTIPTAVVPYTQAFSLGLGTDTEIIYACIPDTPLSSITGTIDTRYKTVPTQDWDITI